MKRRKSKSIKNEFRTNLSKFVEGLRTQVSTKDSQWTVKGFIDVFKNIYTISADTKIVSKILEIHLFPLLLEFAAKHSYRIVLPDHQNYYPDISFVSSKDESIKFAVDFKTTYRIREFPGFCNGFTLGSHGEYFINRDSTKNIQYPYGSYLGHFCLGIIYTRIGAENIDETRVVGLHKLKSIVSVVKDFQFFVCEKWEIASDSSGSGNTANIGSISKIEDIMNCNGMFKNLGEDWFDDYWMNYGKIIAKGRGKNRKKITTLRDFLIYRGKDPQLVNPKASRKK
jgi:hypothetical protein